jgi:nucleoside 2-deoxyribosyltransferase
MRVYLAGPDVFYPDAEARAAAMKAICARYGLVGVSPLDALEGEPAAWGGLAEWRRIARRNEAHITGCAAVIANLTPFRGPSADAGTVYEVGFARALGRVVFGWTEAAEDFATRTRASLGGRAVCGSDGVWRDGDGLLIEAFGLVDNLMIDAGIAESGGAILPAFDRCAAVLASSKPS